jgi:hypothetical protein
LILRGNSYALSGTTTLTTLGKLTLESTGTVFSSAVSLPSTFNIDAGVTGLTIGKTTNDKDITLNKATSINGPIAIYGGNITVSQYANLTSTAAGKGIMLKATGNITSNSDVNYTTNAGDITFWSDSDGSGAGYIYVYDRNIIDSRTNANRTSSLISTASGGGTITLGGGNTSTTLASGTVVPTGYAVENSGAAPGGVALGYFNISHASGTSLYSGGGDITVRGKSTGAWST